LSKHRSRLRAGKHFNRALQRDWNRYGEDAFVDNFVVETAALDKSLTYNQKVLALCLRESAFINNYPSVYNVIRKTWRQPDRTGQPHTAEVRKYLQCKFRETPEAREARLQEALQNPAASETIRNIISGKRRKFYTDKRFSQKQHAGASSSDLTDSADSIRTQRPRPLQISPSRDFVRKRPPSIRTKPGPSAIACWQ
jgi:hypothetical protein